MKRSGSELGNLPSRLMAYVQLKKKDTIRIGEITPILDITDSQERSLLHRLSASGWIVRLKRGVYLLPSRLPAGGTRGVHTSEGVDVIYSSKARTLMDAVYDWIRHKVSP